MNDFKLIDTDTPPTAEEVYLDWVSYLALNNYKFGTVKYYDKLNKHEIEKLRSCEYGWIKRSVIENLKECTKLTLT